ncbi:MAG: transcription-repair coupling factor [Planctomycetes bacterium]|nr:transcription-repair coupling factor [Planctomycetota bacterium]
MPSPASTRDSPVLSLEAIIAQAIPGRECRVGGLWGSSPAWLCAEIQRTRAVSLLVVTRGVEEAERFVDDLTTFHGEPPLLFPAWEDLGDTGAPDPMILGERLRTLLALLAARGTGGPPVPAGEASTRDTGGRRSAPPRPICVVASVQALLQPVAPPDRLPASALLLRVGDPLNLTELAERLVDAGWSRTDTVEFPGEFSIRGGICDLFADAADAPLRIEMDGANMGSLRRFDPGTQRTSEPLRQAEVLCAPRSLFGPRLHGAPGESAALWDYLPPDSWVAVEEPPEAIDRARRFLEASPGAAAPALDEAWTALRSRTYLALSSLPMPEGPGTVNLRTRSLQRLGGALAAVFDELERLLAESIRPAVYCVNPAESQRFQELIEQERPALKGRCEVRIGRVHHGFVLEAAGIAFIGHQELFARYAQRRAARRLKEARPIETFLELERGDLVVHADHGIGRYRGLERSVRDGVLQEFLVCEYAEAARLFVPISRIDLLQKYIGNADRPPPLSRLGSEAWGERKKRVSASLEEMARELIAVQALRDQQRGIAYPKDTPWQREFEASFPYEDTEDQIEITQVLKKDMESPRPMDRLICGDVGFGKTELAMRAAMKAALYGKQVAVLVPTTVLAQQHLQNFRERMADYPIAVAGLSRFRTEAEARQILEGLRTGGIDIVIGTHSLLQPNIGFKDLGLVIIDEEQRFGVEHKERLKRLRATVDVLTLTATPIPRTLHMGLLGIRDVSTLSTPPQDRRAIRTEVARETPELVRAAILRELNRDGQVYFLHNRVYSIQGVADWLQRLVPEARFAVVHGQMSEDILESHMVDFVERRTDVLVTTTIIESGVDIPNVNTILIHHAHQFGLADLHQLRGRVGRYKHQAFAYLLLPNDEPVSPEAAQRLQAIREFNELGAGFQLAMRDMEIRGVGNILGKEQHGHICAVGYDLYCRLLSDAARKARKETAAQPVDASVDLDVEAMIPDAYTASERTKIEIYRRLSRAASIEEVSAVKAEMEDRFGPLPPPAQRLVEVTEVKVLAQGWRIRAISQAKDGVRCIYADPSAAEQLRRRAGRNAVRIVDGETLLVPAPPRGGWNAVYRQLRETFRK